MLTPQEIKKLREGSELTQQQMAELFGYASVRSWQKKEETGSSGRGLSHAEEQYFLLITNNHLTFKLVKKKK